MVPATLDLIAPPREVRVPYVAEAPLLDGKLEDPVWGQAALLTDFTAWKPIEGAAPTQETKVYVYRDDKNLYFAFDATDREPRQVRATFSDRDKLNNDDAVGVILDPFEDQRRGFIFIANPRGVQMDCVWTETSGGNEDCTWDAIYYTAGRLNDHGYTVEMAIPFASLRFDPARDSWGFNAVRAIQRNGEQDVWSPVLNARGGLLPQDGHLRGMKGIALGVIGEVIPELTMRSGPGTDSTTAMARTSGGVSGGPSSGDLGLSAKIARNGNALDLTVHPDFSQVESDPSKILQNQRFALQYDERRPFFLEGKELFASMPWQIVYTRSVVSPDYGIKATGKAGSTSYAVLNASDAAPAATFLRDQRWNPSLYGGQAAVSTAAATASDLSDALTMGAAFTDKHIGPAWNRVGGIDELWKPGETTQVVGQALFSASDNPDATVQEGQAVKLRVIHNDRHWQSWNWYEEATPGFRAEMGFIPRVGYRQVGTHTVYRVETGRSAGVIALRPGVDVSDLTSTANTDSALEVDERFNVDFPSWGFGVVWYNDQERFEDTLFTKSQLYAGVGGAPAKWITFDLEEQAGTDISYFRSADPYLGSYLNVQLTGDFQPVDRFDVAFSISRAIFSSGGVFAPAQEELAHDGEKIVFDATVAHLVARVFLTQDVSARVIADYDDTAGTLTLSGLLSYRPGPGTVIYLGGQTAQPIRPGVDTSQSRAVFTKVAWLFRE